MNNDKIIKAIKNLWVKGFLMSIVAFLLASIAMFFGAASVAAMFFTGNITNLAGLLGLALVWVLIYITLAGFAVEAINKFKFPKVKKLTDVGRFLVTGFVFTIFAIIVAMVLGAVTLGNLGLTLPSAIVDFTTGKWLAGILTISVGTIIYGWIVQTVDKLIGKDK